MCNLCKTKKQTIIHLLKECEFTERIYKGLEQIFTSIGISCNFDLRSILFNCIVNNPSDHIRNFIILITKQYIFHCKCENIQPNLAMILREMRLWYKIEIFNSFKNGKNYKVVKKWSPIVQMITRNESNICAH